MRPWFVPVADIPLVVAETVVPEDETVLVKTPS
jgi:hypothetical protein